MRRMIATSRAVSLDSSAARWSTICLHWLLSGANIDLMTVACSIAQCCFPSRARSGRTHPTSACSTTPSA